ncbi:MAG: undecaprenyl-diphosphate phosphatase [Flavobacteriales bacterium]|jgi:undecaprenyl-diphosphatase|nr:undecaprenyl-diphosphate phosphatase [Flavobacteriales bacterium]
MGLIEALVLGIIQGLTEFLPVSSSGHIELGKAVLGVHVKDPLLFSLTVHLATALSTIVVFRLDIWMLTKLIFEREWWNAGRQYALYILITMVPAAFVGLFFKDDIEMLFDSNTLLVGLMLLITGLLLFLTTRVRKKRGKINIIVAVIVGIAQAIAILPGISRSGATIATGLLLGTERSRMARFSFLMVLPVIIGASILELKDYFDLRAGGMAEQAGDVSPAALVIGFLAAFISGLFACKWMLNLVRNSRLDYFAWYCFAVGIISIYLSL